MKWLLFICLFFFEAYSEPSIQQRSQNIPYYVDTHLLKPHSFSPNLMPDIPCNTFYVSDEVSAYIDEALSLFQMYSINKESLDWKQFENRFYHAVNYCAYTWQTYPQMEYIAKWLDKHTHFSSPDVFASYFTEEHDRLDEIQARILENNIAYLKVPPTNCESGAYAKEMRSLIRKLDQSSPRLWIIDLRENWGGDNWEMLAGLSPLFDHGISSYYGEKPNEDLQACIIEQGKIWLLGSEWPGIQWEDSEPLLTSPSYFAVLIDEWTASAGESVAIAFKGKPNVKFFGAKTCGVTTGISLCTLSDSSVLGIASIYEFDKNKQNYPDGITPDVEIVSEDPEVCLQEAIKWLNSQKL